MWVRGLKLRLKASVTRYKASHPMWVRGLKHQEELSRNELRRRTLCGCVD